MERVQYLDTTNYCDLCTNELNIPYFLVVENGDTFKLHKNCCQIFAKKQLDETHYWTDEPTIYFVPLWQAYTLLHNFKIYKKQFNGDWQKARQLLNFK